MLVGEPGKVSEAPAAGGRWIITGADPNTSVVIFHHGGTCPVDGSMYVERIEYASESTKDLVKQTFKFTVKIEGDTLTQTGVGNPFNEVWKRVK